MRTLIYVAVVVLIIAWLLGWFHLNVSKDTMHIIIIIAVIFLAYALISNRSRLSRRRWW